MLEDIAQGPLNPEVKGLALEMIREGQKILKDEDDIDQAIHEVRKVLKRLRALVRLIRDDLGETQYKSANIAFRDAGRLLSGARDQYVFRQCLEEIRSGYGKYLKVRVFKSLETRLQEQHNLELASLEKDKSDIDEVRKTLEEMVTEVKSWELKDTGFDNIGSSIARVYHRGHSALQTVMENPDPHKYHEWRKRVKYLYYQFGYIRALWPRRMQATEESLGTLAGLLGQDHDYAVFSQYLSSHPNLFKDEVHLLFLQRALERERMKLQEEALPLGQRLYAEETEAFVSRLEGYWGAMKKDAD